MPKKKTTSKSLPFKDINPRLGADELIKRLKACLKYVEDCDPLDDTMTSELLSLSATLISSQIISHKHREVPLLSACILVCIIKLFYEDDMPFGEEQSKKMFSLFISQMSTLENPSCPLFTWGFSLLETLAALKAFNYCLEIEAPDIISELFAKILSVVNGNQSSKLHLLLMTILVDILQDGQQVLPMEAFDTIMMCILEPQKSNNPITYDFVCQLIKKTSLHFEHHVKIFFSSSCEDESPSSSLNNRLYDIIHALHQIDSTVLLSVLPQLENSLQTTDENDRMEVTRVLARMFGAKDSQLSIENRPLWQRFLGRFQDVSSSIRCECVTFSKYFLVYHQNMREDTAEKLLDRLRDGDEKVRLAAVKTITEVADEDMSCVPDNVFCALRDRMRDRKLNVRKETIQSLCRVYRHVMDKDTMSQSDKDKIDWIPNKLLHCLFQKIREDNILVTRGLLSCIIPVSLKPDAKVTRLLHIYNSLDENALRAFEDFMRQRRILRQLFTDIITIHQDDNLKDNERKKLLLSKTVSITTFLPEPTKSLDHLRELISSLSDISHDLLQCVSVDGDYATITKAKSEVLNSFSSRPLVMDSIKSLLDMSSPILVDRECVKELVTMVTKELSDPSLCMSEELEEEEMIKSKNGLNLIKMLCCIEPAWFQQESVLTDLLTVLRHEDKGIVENSILSLTKIGRNVQEWSTVSGCLQPILIGFVTKATPRIAKLAVKCLHKVYNETDLLIERLLKSLLTCLDIESPDLLTTLSSLSQIARLYPLKFCSKHKLIVHKFIVPMVLDVENDPPDKDTKSLWVDEEHLQYDVRLKIASIKLLVCWLIGLHNIDSKEDLKRHCKPVFELLTRILESDGDKERNTSFAGMSHMRLTAATGFLKLVRYAGLMEYITIEHFQLLNRLSYDPSVEVRVSFINKLFKGLKTFSLPLQYLSLFCLATEVPDTLPKSRIKEMLVFIIKLRRDRYNSMKKKTELPDTIRIAQMLPEYSLSYIIYLISHHEKFSRTLSSSLNHFRDHLWFFLEPLVSKTDNFGFLQKMMDGIKETVCTDDPDNSEMNKNVYSICDLVMGILHDKKTTVTWGEFPGKVILPNCLFKQSCSKKSQPNDIRYLPPDYRIFPDKGTKSDTNRDPTPKKRKRPGTNEKNTSTTSTIDSSVSDIDATPTKKKQATPSNKPATRKRSPKKQTKIPFKTKNLPVTSTPAVTNQDEKKTAKRNSKRKVLQEDNNQTTNNSNLRRSPRKRKLATEDNDVTISSNNELMNTIIPEDQDQEEGEETEQQETQVTHSPPAKISKIISSTSPVPTVKQSEIKNRRRVTRRR